MSESQPWRVFILHRNGTLGREIRYGWSTIEHVRQWTATRVQAFDLRAVNGDTRERWNRIGGQWSKVEGQPAAPAAPAPAPPAERPRYYWEDLG